MEKKLEEKVNVAIKEMIYLGYKPSLFMTMIYENGLINAIKKLIYSKKIPDGFVKLWEMNRLDLSMENIVYTGDWGTIFSQEEKEIAKKRLIQYGYIKVQNEKP